MSAAIYCDHNATTPIDPEVIEVVARTQQDAFGNPGSRHAFGRTARRVLEENRERLAALVGAHPDEVIFTSGATEANNLAIRGLVRGTPGVILSSPGEHPSVRETCAGFQLRGWQVKELPVDEQGRLLEAGWRDEDWMTVRLATALLAHNETGVIQNLSGLAQRSREELVPLHVDATQAVGKIPVNFGALQVASLSFGAHKFHGPRGIGVLLAMRGLRLEPMETGGHQEQGRRGGTEAVALIAGMTHALEKAVNSLAETAQRIRDLRDHVQQGLLSACGPAVVIGTEAERLPNTLNIAFPGIDGEALLVALDLVGVASSLGTTCASGALEPAPILQAMGFPPEIQKSAVRLSFGRGNTREEMDDLLIRFARVIEHLRLSAT